jgi:hypothetical protein
VTDLEVPGQAPAGHYVFTAHAVNPVKDTTLDTDAFVSTKKMIVAK